VLTYLLWSPSGVAATLATGADLARACQDDKSPGPCINYLLNAADGHEVFAKWGAIATQWCMPEVGYVRLRRDYLAYYTAHDALAELPVNEAVSAAFTATYPCSPATPTAPGP